MTQKERVQAKRIRDAIEVATQYGGIDGAHHKQWVIDQMLQKLMSPQQYKRFVETRADGPNGEPDYYSEWDKGTPP